ncbi:MAG: hypothetical protein J6Z05_05740 [Lachnospiraceae bacterium]|nr:hypothetical protein [Lachnospiraceae bacterium]
MKKKICILLMLCTLLAACTGKNDEETKTETKEKPAVLIEKIDETPAADTENEPVSDDQAITAIKNYCHMINPDLENIEKEGEYPVYWEVVSSDENEIVVLFRSYTGAQIRYYIDPVSGDAYVTEFVPGITSEEEKTDEELNVRDYLD